MEHLYDSFNNSKITQRIIFRLQQGFDTISHDILTKRLPLYNFKNDVFNLLKSYY